MAKASDFEGKKQDELFYFVDYSPEEAERVGYSNYSYWGSVIQNFLKQKVAVFCLILFLALSVFSFIALAIGKYDYTTLISDTSKAFIKPNSEYWFGTDNLGRDYWCQVWYATQVSIRLALIVAVGESILGVIIGLIWGYVRKLDRFFTELYNICDNIPSTIILILISYVASPSIKTLILGMSIKGWIEMARFIRNQILIIRDRDYNVASRCIGTPTVRIVLRNLLPYLVSVIMLRMALTIPEAIGNEVFITYIGLGLSVETPSLGNLVNDGRKVMMQAGLRYQLLYPTLILSFVTIAFYLIGNAFSDAADPKNHMQ